MNYIQPLYESVRADEDERIYNGAVEAVCTLMGRLILSSSDATMAPLNLYYCLYCQDYFLSLTSVANQNSTVYHKRARFFPIQFPF